MKWFFIGELTLPYKFSSIVQKNIYIYMWLTKIFEYLLYQCVMSVIQNIWKLYFNWDVSLLSSIKFEKSLKICVRGNKIFSARIRQLIICYVNKPRYLVDLSLPLIPRLYPLKLLKLTGIGTSG